MKLETGSYEKQYIFGFDICTHNLRGNGWHWHITFEFYKWYLQLTVGN